MADDKLLLTSGGTDNLLLTDGSNLLLASSVVAGGAPGPGGTTLHVQFSPTTDPLVTPVWVDITADVMTKVGINIKRGGRSTEFDKFTAGRLTFTLKNTSRNYDPGYTSGAYYGNLKPLRQVRVVVIKGVTTATLFTGFILAWPQEYDLSNNMSVVPIVAADGYEILQSAKLSDNFLILDDPIFGLLDRNRLAGEADPVPEELAGSRVARVLDLIEWPTGERDIDAGLALLQVDTIADSPLAYIHRIEESEDGFFFMSKEGKATFRQRSSRWTATRQTTVQLTLDDDGTDTGYRDVRINYDRDLVVNEVGRGREGGDVLYATDSDSRKTYGTRNDEITNLLCASDFEAKSRAEYRLFRFKVPIQRPEPVAAVPLANTAQIPTLIGLELLDRVRLHRRPLGGTVQTFTGALQSIEHHITDDWHMVVSLAPGEIDDTDYFTLDSDALDGAAVLAY